MTFKPGTAPFRKLEVEIAWPGSTGEELLGWVGLHYGDEISYAPSEVCLALKLSHRFKKNSVHFEKTRRDILTMRKAGITVSPNLQPWLLKRTSETNKNKLPRLNQRKDGFFDPSQIRYIYDHDSIHLAVARGEDGLPAYTKFHADGAEVKVDREKWEKLDDTIKLNAVIEESTVLALERHQIPTGLTTHDPSLSFRLALQKLCTHISSGWFREWAWEHYDDALAEFNKDYTNLFNDALRRGVVKPYASSPWGSEDVSGRDRRGEAASSGVERGEGGQPGVDKTAPRGE